MIIKVLTSKTPRYFQILEYLNKNEEKTYNAQNQIFIYKQNLVGNSNKHIAREFMLNENNRIYKKSNNIKFSQEILAFSDLDHDKLTIPIIEDLTKYYLRQRSPYMQAYAIAHFNNNSYHVHIIASPIELHTGLNLRMTKSQFAEFKVSMQSYQQERYPELSQSLVRHGLGQDKGAELGKATFKPSKKNAIIEIINQCLQKSNNQTQFYELLKELDILPYQRGNNIQGVIHNNRKYRLSTLIPDFNQQLEQLSLKQENMNELSEIRNESIDREIQDMRNKDLFDIDLEDV